MFELDVSNAARALERFAAALEPRVEVALRDTAEESLFRLQAGMYWKSGTGGTAQSFRLLRPGADHYRVQSKSLIAAMLDTGTRAHWIRPKTSHGLKGPVREGQSRRAKTDIGTHRVALRFVQNGTLRFASAVFHPGTKAINYVSTEQKLGEQSLHSRGERAVAEAASSAGLS